MKTTQIPTIISAANTELEHILRNYNCLPGVYDEIYHGSKLQPEIAQFSKHLAKLAPDSLRSFHFQAQKILTERGVTFRVYSNNQSVDHIFPFDLVPRILCKKEWQHIEAGLKQRVVALNKFLADIYGEQKIIKDKHLPLELVMSSSGFMAQMVGVSPAGGVHIHIAGIDIIRNQSGELAILEDNLRVPSGVSYALENRRLMKQFFQEVMKATKVRDIDGYPGQLSASLISLEAPPSKEHQIVLLTPGPYNSAYFEHRYLAKKLDCPLVQGNDLLVKNDKLYLKTPKKLKHITIVYRRIDDDFIDPEVFNKDSLLGVPGLFRAYVKGNVILANALGNGIADDKAIYRYVPNIIRYYLNEEPILNQIITYSCSIPSERQFVLENIASLVIKVVNQSGGYGMLIGPQATKAQIEEIKQRIIADPRLYIAQPLVELSSCPTLDPVSGSLCPRRVDLRPYVLLGKEIWVLPGGLTRVALRNNSYVVNSSQGGGSKDTWILD